MLEKSIINALTDSFAAILEDAEVTEIFGLEGDVRNNDKKYINATKWGSNSKIVNGNKWYANQSRITHYILDTISVIVFIPVFR